MSNFLAIATVTATLRQILDDAVSKDVNGASATAVRPNAPTNQLPNPGVNVYLYHVTPNAAWRNADVPTRGADGGLMQRPRTAIDLHYLLSFYGGEGELEPQRVLGSAIRALHEQPILPRKKIRDVINASAFLTTSNLDEEVELVKFTQLPLSLEELGKLWSVFFQTTHVLSVAFQGTVVLIEGKSTPRSTLPVRERNLYVVSFRQPVIEQIVAAAGAGQPIIAGSTLRISGVGLRGNVTRVRIGQALATPTPDQVSDTQIDVALPAGLRAGIQSAQVEHPTLMGTPPTLHSGVESNAAAFVLQPTITLGVSGVGPTLENGSPVIVDGVTLQSATITATFTPSVGRTQRVKLVLYEFNAPEGRPARAYAFDAPLANGIANPAQTETASIAFGVSRVFPGAYLVRVQVDGAESPLSRRCERPLQRAPGDDLMATIRDGAVAEAAAPAETREAGFAGVTDWNTANQRYLRAALNVVRAYLTRSPDAAEGEQEVARGTARSPGCGERDALALCAGYTLRRFRPHALRARRAAPVRRFGAGCRLRPALCRGARRSAAFVPDLQPGPRRVARSALERAGARGRAAALAADRGRHGCRVGFQPAAHRRARAALSAGRELPG